MKKTRFYDPSALQPDKVFHAKLTPRYWGILEWMKKEQKKKTRLQ